MSILSSVSNQISYVANVVTTNASALASKAYTLGGRVVGSVTPALNAVVSKIKNIVPPTFAQKAWAVASSRGGVGAFAFAGAVYLLVKSTAEGNTALQKWGYRVAGVAAVAFSAVLITTKIQVGSL